MTQATRRTAAEAAPMAWAPTFNPFDSGAAQAAFEAMLQAQQQQWDALMAWQKALAEMQQEAWDQWVSHWAGGVPIDA